MNATPDEPKPDPETLKLRAMKEALLRRFRSIRDAAKANEDSFEDELGPRPDEDEDTDPT